MNPRKRIYAYLALAFCSPAAAAPADKPAAPLNEAWHQMAAVASEVCRAPDAYGYFRQADGRLTGSLDTSSLFQRLAKAGLGASVRVGAADWKGVLQRDMASALASRNNCASSVFSSMSQSLSLTSVSTNKAVPKPAPRVITRVLKEMASNPPQSTQSQAANSGQTIQNYNSPAVNTQGGPASSNNQTGGVTAGIYMTAPPATEQERAVALYRLTLELSDLAQFPGRPVKENARSMLQGMLTNPLAARLYEMLSRYYQPTIISLPLNPTGMWKYRIDYYNAERAQAHFEQNILTDIGRRIDDKSDYARAGVLKYFILRESEHSVESVKGEAQFLFGVDPAKAEELFQDMIVIKQEYSGLTVALATQIDLSNRAGQLVSLYATQQ